MTAEFKTAVADGLSNFAATCQVHGDAKANDWAHQGYRAVENMFYSLNDDKVGIGFFHSPTIELVAWYCGATHDKAKGWDQLKDMEGLVFTHFDNSPISVAGKITVQPDAAK